MTLYLPIGPPASGKSFLVNQTIEAGVITRDAVICPDDLRRIMTGDHASQDANVGVFTIVEIIAKARLCRGLDVWVDATNLVGRETFLRIAKEHSQPVVRILMTTTDWVCLQRNDARNKPVPNDVMLRMLAEWALYADGIDPNGNHITDLQWKEQLDG